MKLLVNTFDVSDFTYQRDLLALLDVEGYLLQEHARSTGGRDLFLAGHAELLDRGGLDLSGSRGPIKHQQGGAEKRLR